MKRATQGVVVRHFFHADAPTPVLAVPQQRFDLAVTLALMLLDDQTGEQLWKGEVFATELAGVLWQGLSAEQKSGQHHLPW